MAKPFSRTAALIVAAGRGTRFGGAVPKQYMPLGDNRPVLRHTVDCFAAHPAIDAVVVVIHPEDTARARSALNGLNVQLVHGGSTRQASVYCGLLALTDRLMPDHILIHDGARPFVSTALINATLNALNTHSAVVPVLPIVDAVAYLEQDHSVRPSPPVSSPVALQTPQGFSFMPLLKAHHQHRNKNMRDDTSIAHAAGLAVHTIEGCPKNIKITYAEDLYRPQFTTRAVTYY